MKQRPQEHPVKSQRQIRIVAINFKFQISLLQLIVALQHAEMLNTLKRITTKQTMHTHWGNTEKGGLIVQRWLALQEAVKVVKSSRLTASPRPS